MLCVECTTLWLRDLGNEETRSRRIETFEAWIYRRMERITWRGRVTNEEVLRRIGESRKLLDTIRKR